MLIDGPSAKFKIDGQVDLTAEAFDNEVLVILPLSDNVAVVTVLAGAPQVGVPLYLLSKAFGGIFEQFTSASYKVTGPWDDPEVELVKVLKAEVEKNVPKEEPIEQSETTPPTEAEDSVEDTVVSE